VAQQCLLAKSARGKMRSNQPDLVALLFTDSDRDRKHAEECHDRAARIDLINKHGWASPSFD
jgi:hypothetical protein